MRMAHHRCSHFYIFLTKIPKAGVELNEAESLFRMLLSGVPQGSILVPIHFNIFLNELLPFVT